MLRSKVDAPECRWSAPIFSQGRKDAIRGLGGDVVVGVLADVGGDAVGRGGVGSFCVIAAHGRGSQENSRRGDGGGVIEAG
ncbi:MAG: hypothetical protein AUK47_14325 [Deltaproteobacteria bacterium CG2_30_63_29]|nr:MAG: hypothetical protein AUK47_14325 [Deltaproteobacteria bacterium CG2_30_63_29]PJB45210.1 MAG: hypothetical protein CO108_07645 [Deltaproteobacteria bacterium CG_4_9_14_3_um_filter_63_12]